MKKSCQKFVVSIFAMLTLLFAVGTFSSCSAFKKQRCDRCPEFTEHSEGDVKKRTQQYSEQQFRQHSEQKGVNPLNE